MLYWFIAATILSSPLLFVLAAYLDKRDERDKC